MPRYLPTDVGATANAAAVEVLEDGTTFIPEVIDSLELYDGGTTVVVVEIEYRRVGGVTPAAARCIGVVFARFGTMPIGTVAVRFIEGTTIWSQHSHMATPSISCVPARSCGRWRSSSTGTAAGWTSRICSPTRTSPRRSAITTTMPTSTSTRSGAARRRDIRSKEQRWQSRSRSAG